MHCIGLMREGCHPSMIRVLLVYTSMINNFIKNFVASLYKAFVRGMNNGIYSELGLIFMMSRSIFGFSWFKQDSLKDYKVRGFLIFG
jgi:hypothetical protein